MGYSNTLKQPLTMPVENTPDLDRVMQALPPQARVALNLMSQMQNRSPEDVLREEIATYIAGRLPNIPIEATIKGLQTTAYGAGWMIGRLRRIASNMSET